MAELDKQKLTEHAKVLDALRLAQTGGHREKQQEIAGKASNAKNAIRQACISNPSEVADLIEEADPIIDSVFRREVGEVLSTVQAIQLDAAELGVDTDGDTVKRLAKERYEFDDALASDDQEALDAIDRRDVERVEQDIKDIQAGRF